MAEGEQVMGMYTATLRGGHQKTYIAGSLPDAMKQANKAGYGDHVVKWETPEGITFETHYKHL